MTRVQHITVTGFVLPPLVSLNKSEASTAFAKQVKPLFLSIQLDRIAERNHACVPSATQS
jgi:hypothetical protein